MRFGVAWLVFLFGVSCVPLGRVCHNASVVGFFHYGFPIGNLFYFSLGMYLVLTWNVSRLWKCMPRFLKPWLCLLVGLGFLAINVYMDKQGIDPAVSMVSLSIPFLMYGVWTMFVPQAKWSDIVTSSAFPIYLMHGIFIAYLCIAPRLICGLACWILSICLSIAVTWLIVKVSPKTADFIFAGRATRLAKSHDNDRLVQ